MEDANGQESQQPRGLGEVSIDMGSLSASETKILEDDDGDEDSAPLVITRRRVGRGVRLPVHLVVVCTVCVSIHHAMVYVQVYVTSPSRRIHSLHCNTLLYKGSLTLYYVLGTLSYLIPHNTYLVLGTLCYLIPRTVWYLVLFDTLCCLVPCAV